MRRPLSPSSLGGVKTVTARQVAREEGNGGMIDNLGDSRHDTVLIKDLLIFLDGCIQCYVR